MSGHTSQVPSPRRSMEKMAPSELVVVGVDGSDASMRALVWALNYAVDHDAVVEVVTAWPVHAAVFVHEVPGHFNQPRWQAVQAQERVIAQARSSVAALPRYTVRFENAPALDALIRAAEPASLLVLGTDRAEPRGAGSWASMTVRARHAAQCPVILIPNHPEPVDADPLGRSQPEPAAAH